MCKKVQKCTSIILLVFLSSFWFSGESYPADPKVRIIVNPNTTEVEAGAEPLALTAQAIGTKLKYKWTLIGFGKISAADLPAVFYTPPTQINGKSAQAVVTVTITDNSGQETTASVTFNISPNPEQKEQTPPKESKATKKGMSKTTKIALGAGAVAALGGGIALAVIGSGDDDSSSKQAQIIIRSDPDPVPYGGISDDGSNFWRWTLYVEEKAGVGATIVEWFVEFYTNSGELTYTQTLSQQEFIDWLNECDQNHGYINPNGKVCGGIRTTRTVESGYTIENMKFIDDNDNVIWVTGRVTFLAP